MSLTSFIEDVYLEKVSDLEKSIEAIQWREREMSLDLEELVEAIEWRDESNALYSEMYADWANVKMQWPNSIDSIFYISEAAEIAYEKALSKAKTYFEGERRLKWIKN
jgi:hypothetical protein